MHLRATGSRRFSLSLFLSFFLFPAYAFRVQPRNEITVHSESRVGVLHLAGDNLQTRRSSGTSRDSSASDAVACYE